MFVEESGVNKVSKAGDTMTGTLATSTGFVNGSGTGLSLQIAGATKLAVRSGVNPGTVFVLINSESVVFPVQKPTASAPTYVEGGIYYDTTLHKLRVGGATGWETVTST